MRSVELVEPAVIGKWKKAPDLPYAIADAAAVSVHDDVFIFGGTNGKTIFNNILRLENVDWHHYGTMLRRRYLHTYFHCRHILYAKSRLPDNPGSIFKRA